MRRINSSVRTVTVSPSDGAVTLMLTALMAVMKRFVTFLWHGTAPMMSSSVITLCVSRCPGNVMERMTVAITLMRTLRNAETFSAHLQEISVVGIIAYVSGVASAVMVWTTVETIQMRPTVETTHPHAIKTSSSAAMANASVPTCGATSSMTVKITAQMRLAARQTPC